MGSAHIPPPREDDPEEVADKLSIAAAMWARGETHDALQWLRRAAESASDAEADIRALELAKAAAELANAAPAQPAAPASSAQPAARPLQSTAPTGVKPTAGVPPPKHSAPPPKPMSRPAPPKPSMRPGGPPAGPPAGSGKLAPLPPLRPLGTAPPAQKPGPRRSESGTSPAATAPIQTSAPALAPLIDEPIDHEQTSVMPAAEAQNLARMGGEAAPAPHATADSEEADHLQTMRRDAGDATAPATHQDIHVAETMDPSNPVFAAGHAPAQPPVSERRASEHQALGEAHLPLAVGVRVRVFTTEGGAWIVPDDGASDRGGTAAILVPASADDDLRSLFARK
jgi:hypothetical protein